MSIFVQIAAYRDRELLPTLRDMLDKAHNPNALKICICHQHHPDDEWDNLNEYKDNPNFNIIDIDSRDTKGACWARWRIQQEYNGEDYTLQLDSHHRFIKGWDTELMKMYTQCRLNGSKKPLITSYIPSYDPETNKPTVNVPWMLSYNFFGQDGPLHTIPETIPDWKGLGGPPRARFYSAHFAFADGAFSKDVQHDPEMYFHGEEISIAVRAYTHGYDLFHPHKVLAWHHYGREGAVKHWDDSKTWGKANKHSYSRVRKLFGINGEKFKPGENEYGFGTERTLDDYERYAGIRFSDQSIQQYTLDKHYPPNPFLVGKEYDDSFKQLFRYCITINKKELTCDDYSFWAIVFMDKKGKELYRKDADEKEIKNVIKSIKGDNARIWRSFETNDKVAKWKVWPHSRSKGFQDPITGTTI